MQRLRCSDGGAANWRQLGGCDVLIWRLLVSMRNEVVGDVNGGGGGGGSDDGEEPRIDVGIRVVLLTRRGEYC